MPEFTKGEPDPNTLFLAIGQALSQWEFLELHLSMLYTIFIGKPRNPTAIQQYGTDYGTVGKRVTEVEKAGSAYFIGHPDQSAEGEFSEIMAAVREATLERHRIAHGLVNQIPVMGGEADSDGLEWFGSRFWYYLGAPWYSVGSLKMSPYHMNRAMIDERREQFRVLRERASVLSKLLAPD